MIQKWAQQRAISRHEEEEIKSQSSHTADISLSLNVAHFHHFYSFTTSLPFKPHSAHSENLIADHL